MDTHIRVGSCSPVGSFSHVPLCMHTSFSFGCTPLAPLPPLPPLMFVLLPQFAAVAVKPLRIDGLVAAVFSPFDAAGMLNTSVVPLQNAYLQATGVDWVFVGGTTGESLSLSLVERKALTEAWLSTSASVIAHVGAECLGDARALAAHAQAHGAKAIGAMPPTFFKPANVQALAATLASICAAAPELPCYYYHIPSMTGA